MAASVTMKANLSELDAMLHDLSRGQYSGGVGGASTMVGGGEDHHGDPPERPPPPKGYEMSPPPSSSSNFLSVPKAHSVRSNYSESSTVSTMRRPRHPPKLQHVLVQKDKRKAHDLVKAIHKDYGSIDVPDSDYDYYDYGALTGGPSVGQSNYSTLPEEPEDRVEIELPPPEAMDQVDAGEAPRGDKSMVIKTDYGELKSKYYYLGFGLWENTNPIKRSPPRKASPPPPPPKAEPIWYNCTVKTETHKTSKELDDLEQGLDGYGRIPDRLVEIGNSAKGLPGCLGELYEEFDKEDMSEMFRRAFLEQMGNADEVDKKTFKCHTCQKTIRGGGRMMTAMSHSFHPECFVCAYCKQEFKDRTFKWSDLDNKPYCHRCFEKLLGHYGNAHQ